MQYMVVYIARFKLEISYMISLYFQCNASEFTCDNGICIPMDSRCDNNFDCDDGSDETNCKLLSLGTKLYHKNYPPFNATNQKFNVQVGMTIMNLNNIKVCIKTKTKTKIKSFG